MPENKSEVPREGVMVSVVLGDAGTVKIGKDHLMKEEDFHRALILMQGHMQKLIDKYSAEHAKEDKVLMPGMKDYENVRKRI